jgi:hypothetical protein
VPPFRLFGALLALSAACALAAPAAAKPRANAPASAAAEKDPVLLSRELAGVFLDLGYSSASINTLFNTRTLGEMPAEWLPIFTDATMAEAAARREQLIGMLAPILQSKFTLPELRAGVGYLRTPAGRRTLQAAIRAGVEDRDMTESEVDSGLVELMKKPTGRAFFEKFGELEHELGGFDGEVRSLMAPGVLRRASDGIEATTKPLAPLTAAERDALEVLRALLPEQMMMQGVRAGAEAKAKDKAAMAQLPAGWGGWLVEALVAEMNANPGLLYEILARAWAAKVKPEDLRAMVVFLSPRPVAPSRRPSSPPGQLGFPPRTRRPTTASWPARPARR